MTHVFLHLHDLKFYLSYCVDVYKYRLGPRKEDFDEFLFPRTYLYFRINFSLRPTVGSIVFTDHPYREPQKGKYYICCLRDVILTIGRDLSNGI